MKAARVGLVVLAAALFVARGPLRAIHDSNDFGIVYAAARAWVHGADPYDPATVARERAAAQVPQFNDASATRTPYPPATFPLLAPFALLQWRAASVAWLVATVALVITAILRLARTPSLIAFMLAFAPLHTGIAKGNLSIAAAMLALFAIPTGSGVLLGIATALKPQIGAPFLLIPLLGRRWRALAVAAGVAVALLVVGAARTQAAAPQWIDELRANYASLAQPGGLNDASPANPYRYHLINLQMPLAELHVPTVIAWLAAAVLLALLLARGPRDPLIASAAIGAIILLPLYRRFYDAALLLAAVPWAWRFTTTRQRVALVALLPFLIPGAALLHTLLPSMHGVLWDGFVIPHAAWCTLVIATCLVTARAES